MDFNQTVRFNCLKACIIGLLLYDWALFEAESKISRCTAQIIIGAGWSSLVARRAHNPKVVGSNPAPATNFEKYFDSF